MEEQHTYVAPAKMFTESEEPAIMVDKQLSYIGQDILRIPPVLFVKYGEEARRVDFSFNCISDLEGVQGFLGIEELILDNNEMGDNSEFPPLSSLTTLSLNKNKILDLDGLLGKVAASYPRLKHLSLLGNKACPNRLSSPDKDEEDYSMYRLYVIYKLPSLKFLDASAVSDQERSEASRRGGYLRVVRPKSESMDGDNSTEAPSSSSQYNPLPSEGKPVDAGKKPSNSTFGNVRYVYYGKHSEGNRFIRNRDL